MDIIFATKNTAKINEANEILRGSGLNVIPMSDIGINPEVVEDGETFEANAVKKAVAVMRACGRPVIADDSGLEIDFLNGRPGVRSARFMGEDTPYGVKNAEIIRLLSGAPTDGRGARFVCAVAAAFPDGTLITETGTIAGTVAFESAGENGFGYDPIFFVPEFNMTTAEMAPERKHAISHRGLALRKILARILEIV